MLIFFYKFILDLHTPVTAEHHIGNGNFLTLHILKILSLNKFNFQPKLL